MESYKPASFRERGVAMPFTTPQLAGAKVRPAERTGTEFVIPNPSGGRGVYVLQWGGVRQFCRPTVHDTLLYQRTSRLPVLEPGGVRRVARQLASEGFAGRDAMLAATAAAESDKKELLLINFLLLITLMEQIEPAGLRISIETEHTPELGRRAQRVITRFGATIGRDVSKIGADLEALSPLFVPIGLDADTPPARATRLIQRLEAVADGLAAWQKRHAADEFSVLAGALGSAASVSAIRAAAVSRAARALTRDMGTLLRAWVATPAIVAGQVNRPEWVLDGWERFCLLWENASHLSTQRAALGEMAPLVPSLPKEAADWGLEQPELEPHEAVFRAARLNDSWRRGGASQGLIARNERLQALLT